MKKFRLNSLTSIVITMAIMLSCGGYLFADDTEQPEVIEEPVIEQVEEEQPEVTPEDAEQPENVEPEIVEPEVAEPEVVEESETDESVDESGDVQEIISYEEVVNVDFEYDNNELAEQYIMNEMAIGNQVCYASVFDYNEEIAGLNDNERLLLNYLSSEISKIASGDRESYECTEETEPGTTITYLANTVIEIPVEMFRYRLEDVGYPEKSFQEIIDEYYQFNHRAITETLLYSCPYEMYWYDKTDGMRFGYKVFANSEYIWATLTFRFSVAQDYRVKNYESNRYLMESSYGLSASAAARNARSIVYAYDAFGDYDKLLAYNDEICRLVSYNDEAAHDDVDYGNPWQLVWVFDGDPDTEVVCEGYSKAFQYLCDNSVFDDAGLYVICVSGTAHFTSNSGPHMWNIVHINGKNYLLDVTNNDSLGDHCLFLIGYTVGSVTEGYRFDISSYRQYRYEYDDKTIADYGESVLELRNCAYLDPDSRDLSQPAFCGHSMQLSGEIGLQFFFTLPASVDPSTAYITLSGKHVNETYDYADWQPGNKAGTSNAYMVQANISTLQMAETIIPTLYYYDALGRLQSLEGDPYSAEMYLAWGMANIDNTEDLQIVTALANYGYYAYPYLQNVNHWSSNEYAQMSISFTPSTYDYSGILEETSVHRIGYNLSGSDFTRLSYSLRFGDTVSLRIFLETADISTIDTTAFSFNGATPVIGSDGNRITITFTDIPATALAGRFTISYNNALLVSVSPLSYVYGMLNTTGTSDAGRDLVCALYRFAQACSST